MIIALGLGGRSGVSLSYSAWVPKIAQRRHPNRYLRATTGGRGKRGMGKEAVGKSRQLIHVARRYASMF